MYEEAWKRLREETRELSHFFCGRAELRFYKFPKAKNERACTRKLPCNLAWGQWTLQISNVAIIIFIKSLLRVIYTKRNQNAFNSIEVFFITFFSSRIMVRHRPTNLVWQTGEREQQEEKQKAKKEKRRKLQKGTHVEMRLNYQHATVHENALQQTYEGRHYQRIIKYIFPATLFISREMQEISVKHTILWSESPVTSLHNGARAYVFPRNLVNLLFCSTI